MNSRKGGQWRRFCAGRRVLACVVAPVDLGGMSRGRADGPRSRGESDLIVADESDMLSVKRPGASPNSESPWLAQARLSRIAGLSQTLCTRKTHLTKCFAADPKRLTLREFSGNQEGIVGLDRFAVGRVEPASPPSTRERKAIQRRYFNEKARAEDVHISRRFP